MIKNKRMLFFVSVLGLLILLAGCGAKEAAQMEPSNAEKAEEGKQEGEDVPEAGTYRQITQEEALRIMTEDEDVVILDVRTEQEYQEGHIPGAICVPNELIGTEEIPELPDKDQTILVYCRSGRRSKEASEKLAALGYTKILEFGGIMDWTGEVVTE